MPERRDSVDSFDEFFGESKKDDGGRKQSPIQPKQTDSTIAAIVQTQPVIERPQTPVTPEVKPKVTTTTNGYRNPSPVVSNRAESVPSKVYESDFDDDDNAFGDEETVIESADDREKNRSLPPPKQRVTEAPRRGSDSELKSSFTVARQSKPTNGNPRRKGPLLPYIRPQQTRRVAPPVRRHKDSASTATKMEIDQRALSAQTNKLKRLESHLTELQRQLEAQRIENATLRTIQRREEKAIRKYEEKEYDIHRIVRDYNQEIDHIKEVLTNEREVKTRLERQIEVREEKLREQTKRLKKVEKIVEEKNLEERYELNKKLTEADKKLQEFNDKLALQEKHIEHLEKNHRHEINQELNKQRDLKRQLQKRSQKYDELLLKFEDKARQIDTMHIYVQRGGKRSSDSPSNLSKSRSLQSLQETSPRSRGKPNDSEKKRREQNPKRRQERSSSPKVEKKQILPPPVTTKKTEEKPTAIQDKSLPPKGKPPVRRLSTPKSVEDENSDIEDETLVKPAPKTLPPAKNIQRGEKHISHAQMHKRPVVPASSTAGSGGDTTASSSIFKLTEPPAPSKKARPTRDLDEKWSDMFGTNKQEDSAKDDLLAKLVADEQEERRLTAAAAAPPQRPSMTMFESSTRAPTTTQPTAVRPVVDPFESLFNNNNKSSKPAASRTNDLDDIFSTKPANQTTTQPKTDTFDSLFGPASTSSNSTATKPFPSSNDKLQRPKVITTVPRSIPNRTIVDEVEDFVL